MNLEQAIEKITSHWEKVHKKQNSTGYWSHPKSVAVWAAKSDTAGSYEVNEEWIGISPQGNVVWAYASGCSCWDGDYDEETKPTIKEFTLKHDHLPEDWEEKIIKFAESFEIQQF